MPRVCDRPVPPAFGALSHDALRGPVGAAILAGRPSPWLPKTMPLSSMIGFARVADALLPFRWVWELKSVNGRGLDLRLRLPPRFDAVEAAARGILAAALNRGNCSATLTVVRDTAQRSLRLNE